MPSAREEDADQQLGRLRGGGAVAGVGPSAQYLRGIVLVAVRILKSL